MNQLHGLISLRLDTEPSLTPYPGFEVEIPDKPALLRLKSGLFWVVFLFLSHLTVKAYGIFLYKELFVVPIKAVSHVKLKW